MSIGSCDCCDRQNVPVAHLTETYCGDVTACYICQGDDDPDPYGEVALHFVGFKDDRWWNAIKTFGRPDFVHRHWDYRAMCEIAPGDRVVFASGDETAAPTPFAYDDSAHF